MRRDPSARSSAQADVAGSDARPLKFHCGAFRCTPLLVNPNDTTEGRFDRLFGFSRPWSANDYIRWENVIALKNRLELTPHEKLRVDAGYSAFWLASKTDVWSSTGLQDPTGQSGSFLGHELDARVRWAATERLDVTIGYAHFIAGGFTKAQSHSNDSDFFYIQTETRLFK